MAQKKVLFIIAFDGFQQTEYAAPRKLLLNAGYDIVTASNKPGAALAKDGSSVQVNITLDEVEVHNYKAIVFIGGPGTIENLDKAESYTIAKKAFESGILIASICISTRILAHSGILNGKRATGWNGDKELGEIYKKAGALFVENEPIVVDGNIITATGPAVAESFGNTILATLESLKRS